MGGGKEVREEGKGGRKWGRNNKTSVRNNDSDSDNNNNNILVRHSRTISVIKMSQKYSKNYFNHSDY